MSTFPQPWTSTVSHWQATNRGAQSLWNHGRGAALPFEADVVVVGAGMMGAALAYFLTLEDDLDVDKEGKHGKHGHKHKHKGKHVVVLDAKDCGSGATGRNGGHVGPKTYAAWHTLMLPPPLGVGCTAAEAVRLLQSERDNLDLVAEIVARERLDVDFWRGELLETHHTPEETDWGKKTYAAWLAARAALGLGDDETAFVEGEEATKLARMRATSVHRRPSGSVHSHKLCTALLRTALSRGAEFFSWTPVQGFPEKNGKRWAVKTGRGTVLARQVVLCTNAHTPHFFGRDDLIHSHITPFRGQCATITPPPTFAAAARLRHTYSTAHGHYLVTTPTGQLVLGGGVAPYIRDGRIPLEWYTGAVDDSADGIHPVLTKEFMPDHFDEWGTEAHGEGLSRTWVGIMAASRDELPLVGAVPDEDGVFIAAGFSGHGMSRIFVTARALSSQLADGGWDESLLPLQFQVTRDRLARAAEAHAAFAAQNAHAVIVDDEVMDRRAMRPKGAWWRVPFGW